MLKERVYYHLKQRIVCKIDMFKYLTLFPIYNTDIYIIKRMVDAQK